MARDTRDPTDQPGRTVYHRAIDDRLIPSAPQRDAKPAREPRDDVLVEPVEVVFVDQDLVQQAQALAQKRAPVRPPKHEYPCGKNTEQGDIERSGRKAAPRKVERAFPLPT